jgi:hypothetical protein
MYNNRSQDDHREALAPYVERGVAVVHDWPIDPSAGPPSDAAQVPVYEDFIKRHGHESRWVAFIDLDEFLFSPTGRPVSEVLVDFEQWPGIGVNWAVFGTSGHRAQPPGLVTENYVRRTDEWGWNRAIKSIADPSRVRNFSLAHYFMYKDGPTVDENQRPITGPQYSRTDDVSFSRLRINHYLTKSEEEYRRKLMRVRPDNATFRPPSEAANQRKLRILDQVEDRAIQIYLPDLKRALAELEGNAAATGPRGRLRRRLRGSGPRP